jgi:hypothetical protein
MSTASDDPSDFLSSPIGFAELVLGLKLYPWQDEVLSWFEEPGTNRLKASLCTPNGAGKSERVVASLALWWLTVHPRGKVVITTKDGRQLDNQVYPAMSKHRQKLIGWKFVERRIDTPTGGSAVFFTTDEPGRAEGWHKEDDINGPLLIIVDEAKSVPEPIFQAFDRCTYNAILYVSSPGMRSGRFFDSATKDNFGFKAKQVGLAECPHIPKERIEDIRRIYGEDHPFTRSTLYGEFMDEDGENQFVVTPSSVRMLYDSMPEFVDGPQSAFCDFAAGGDENVLAHRVGNRVMPLLCWKDTNTMGAVGRFIVEFTKRGLKPSEIYGDESGLGGPMIDRLAEAGWPINRVNNGHRAYQGDRYQHRGAEMWHEAGQKIAHLEVILPEDDKLKVQLTTRKIKVLSDGRLGVESKEDMRGRGLTSPDRADAVVGVLAVDGVIASSEFEATGLTKLTKRAETVYPTYGTLLDGVTGIVFTEDPMGYLAIWEKPGWGKSYIASLKWSVKGWSFFVVRDQWINEDGQKEVAKLVCRLRMPCEWDGAKLAEVIKPVLKWYGEPPLAADARGGSDAIHRLLDAGVGVIIRPVFDRVAPAKTEVVFGWETNERTADIALGALSKAIREQALAIECREVLRDMRQFQRRDAMDNGDTIALGIAMACIGMASVKRPPMSSPIAMSYSSGYGGLIDLNQQNIHPLGGACG